MGKPTGFLDYEREEAKAISPKERIKNFNEFHEPLSVENRNVRLQDVWIVACHFVRTDRLLQVWYQVVL